MKQKLLLLLSVFLLSANADTVSFSYDSAGNRVKREIIVEKKSAPSHAGTEYFSEIISEKEIKIYPNPTEGVLKIDICGYEDSDNCGLSVYSMSGQLIQIVQAISCVTEIDITPHPNGVYILLIMLNGEESTWKIIKK